MTIRLDVLLGNTFLESPEDVPADDNDAHKQAKNGQSE
jgi:hypothetical protein